MTHREQSAWWECELPESQNLATVSIVSRVPNTGRRYQAGPLHVFLMPFTGGDRSIEDCQRLCIDSKRVDSLSESGGSWNWEPPKATDKRDQKHMSIASNVWSIRIQVEGTFVAGKRARIVRI